MLIYKIDIYINGAEKRKKIKDVVLYKEKKQYYVAHFPELLL
jgi:hypothetical protein